MTESTILHNVTPDNLKDLFREVLREEKSQPIIENGQRLLTPKEAKTLLRISDPTLLKIERRGQLPSVKIGSKKFYRQQDIESFLATNRRLK